MYQMKISQKKIWLGISGIFSPPLKNLSLELSTKLQWSFSYYFYIRITV